MLTSVLTVTQLNRYVKALFDDNKQLSGLMIKGELSNLSDHFSSGHLYFSVKDAGASVKAVMFRSYAQQLKFRPQNGQKVLLSCSVSVYERDGVYQLYVYDMQPDGAGALALAFEQKKAQLAAEGLFAAEHKRPIPRMPRTIGVITSQTGAALQDILSILGRRWPVAAVVVAPVLVQGEKAAEELCAALRALNLQKRCDVILLGRGGGSAEDLSAFNSEALAHAIYASEIPVISAVGHETDYTIADFTADLRAPTPSAAAELAAPDVRELLCDLNALSQKLTEYMENRLASAAARLVYYQNHRALQSPVNLLATGQRRLEQSKKRLFAAMRGKTAQSQSRLAGQVNLLSSLSPLNVLARGYAIAFAGEKPLTGSAGVQKGDIIRVRLASGGLLAQVTETTEETK